MNNTMILEKIKSKKYLLHYHSYLSLIELNALLYSSHECSHGLVLQHHIEFVVVFIHIEKFQDSLTPFESPVHLHLVDEESRPFWFCLEFNLIYYFNGDLILNLI